MILIDSHCHLDSLDYQNLHRDVDEVMARAAERDVKFCLSVATTLSGYKAMVDLIGKRPDIAYSCGVHPLNLDEDEGWTYSQLRQLAANEQVVALGETGLDYYCQQENKAYQQTSFREHIRIGCELNKPVIVHTRNAKADTLAILREEQVQRCGGVLHCFTEDIPMARALLDLGFYISFSGIVTFRNAQALREVVRYVPEHHLLIETDSPWLAPAPHRGKENQPAYVRDIAECVAELKEISLETLARITMENFVRLFHITPNSPV